jgi:CheY-like chemotaxis protein
VAHERRQQPANRQSISGSAARCGRGRAGKISRSLALVHAPQSGQRAIEEAQRGEFSLVVLDVMMPRMDGLETAAALREFAPHLPIIFLSALVQDDDLLRRSRAVGVHEYVTKPFDPAVLSRQIARYEG